MPRKLRGRRGRPKLNPTQEATSGNNTILYIVGGIAAVGLVGGAAATVLTLMDRRKAAQAAKTDGGADTTQPQLSIDTLSVKIETACSELLQKQAKDDNPETAELRQLAESVNPDAETTECRLTMARFLRWRAGFLPKLDLQKELRLVNRLLNYDLVGLSDKERGNWIQTKFDMGFASKSMGELTRLRKFMETFEGPKEIKEVPHTQFFQVNFKLACFFGDWEAVEKWGSQVAELRQVMSNPVTRQKESVPLLQSYQSLAQAQPEKHPNWYIIFFRKAMFKSRFNPLYQSHLQFLNWKLDGARMKYKKGQAKHAKLQEQLDLRQNEDWKPLKVREQEVFIFGSICQLKLKALEETPCILTGPWNDSEMCLVGLMYYTVMQRRMRIEVTVQLERKDWVQEGSKSGSWLWDGQLIYERFLMAPGNMQWEIISQEVYSLEMNLGDTLPQ